MTRRRIALRPAALRLAARRATLVAAALLAAGATAASDARAQDSAAARAPRRPSPLFASDSAITITLTADFRGVAARRDSVNPPVYPLVASYAGADGAPVAVHGRVAARGHFRLRSSTCAFPPLRLTFPDTGTRGTLFARQRSLKLVTHCRDGSYEQHVLREYLAYRAHHLVTPLGFRVRLARVRYVEARDTTRVNERWAFFIESEREMAARNGARLMDEARGALFNHITEESAGLLGLWEYFIGNTDWSLSYLHNVRLVGSPLGTSAVPYDFDFSGLVDAPYAAPSPKLGIRSVRHRLYRGPCLTATQLAPLLARFTAQRAATRALYDSLPALDRGYARRAVAYLEQFYEDAADLPRFARKLHDSCQPGT